MEQKSKNLDDFWENNPNVQKISTVNKKIVKLLDILAASKNPVRMRSRNTGVEITAFEEQGKPLPENSFYSSHFTSGTRAKQVQDLILFLSRALTNKTCDFLPEEEIDVLYTFFSDLEIE